MQAKARRLVLIGLDSALPSFVHRFARQGAMPATGALMARGAWGSALPSLPTHTPTNWTTIATGADPIVHGVVEFNYDSRLRRAEPIWKTVERHGGASLLLRYPATWPRDLERGVVFEHGGNQASRFRVCIAQCYLAGETVQYVGGWHGTQSSMGITLVPAQGWRGLPGCRPAPLAGEIAIRSDDDRRELLHLHLLVGGSRGRYGWVSVHLHRDARRPLCTLHPGEWSPFLVHPFRVGGKRVRAAFRFQLMLLAPDAGRLRLYRSEVYPVEGHSYPEGITEELTAACGPYIGTPGRIPLAAGWMDTYFQEAGDQVDWLVAAARHLFKSREWQLFMMEWHVPDFIAHKFFSYVDPASTEYGPRTARQGWQAFRRTYQLADRLIGGITSGLDDDTLVMVVSDHGHCLRKTGVLLENALAAAGLFDPEHPEQSPVRRQGVGLRVRAATPAGREALRDQAICVLQSLHDEETGICPVALALKGQEAPLIGLSPEQAGDVVFALRAGYEVERYRPQAPPGCYFVPPGIGKWGAAGGTHGAHHPASTYSLGDIKALFLAAGPGVRPGLVLPRPIWLRDVAPTACHLLGLPAPTQATGSVVRELLENR